MRERTLFARRTMSLLLALGVLGATSCSGQRSTPVELIMMRASGPDPFWVGIPHTPERLFGASADEASAALAQCQPANWRERGSRIQQGFTVGTGETKDFVCQRGEIVVLAEVLVDPGLGTDGVLFAACRHDECPAPEIAFQHGADNREQP